MDLLFFLSCVCYAFICALWSPAGKALTSWPSFVVSNYEFVTFPLILGQVWYLIVSIPDLCTLTYFVIDSFLLIHSILPFYLKTYLLEIP